MKTIQDKLKYPQKVKYPQAYSIKVYGVNAALKERMIEYLHHKSKYNAKYNQSKQIKRMYEDKKELKWK